MPDEVTLRIERPEGFEALSDVEWIAKLRDAVRLEEERAREERIAFGRRVLGRKAVLRAEPTDFPNSVEVRRTLRPNIACSDETRRLHELSRLIAFRAERHAALVRVMRGERDVVFPYGTYRIRGFFLARPAPPLLATFA